MSPSYTLGFEVAADRWLRIRDDTIEDDTPFNLDDDGFLIEPGSAHEYFPGELTRPADIADFQVLVLLGEPGAGKTTVLVSRN